MHLSMCCSNSYSYLRAEAVQRGQTKEIKGGSPLPEGCRTQMMFTNLLKTQ